MSLELVFICHGMGLVTKVPKESCRMGGDFTSLVVLVVLVIAPLRIHFGWLGGFWKEFCSKFWAILG